MRLPFVIKDFSDACRRRLYCLWHKPVMMLAASSVCLWGVWSQICLKAGSCRTRSDAVDPLRWTWTWTSKYPLKTVTRVQCDAKPAVTFPTAGHGCPVTGTKSCCLVKLNSTGQFSALHHRDILARTLRGYYGENASVEFKLSRGIICVNNLPSGTAESRTRDLSSHKSTQLTITRPVLGLRYLTDW